VVEIPSGYSKENLAEFRSKAIREHPSLVPIIDDYLRLAENSDTDVLSPPQKGSSTQRRRATNSEHMHLFDLLRDRRAFPSNSDLSDFAGRIIPDMTRKRFDKMSRGEIVAKIIEYVETLDPKTRRDLEASMREAMKPGVERSGDRRSFMSKWERIIKGIQL
jgi:hypothetical protein